MDVILVRYAEVGLKSPGVRRYFENILIDNLLNNLAHHEIEALVDCEQGRIHVTTDKIAEAIPILTKVFGVASVSPAYTCSSEMTEMCQEVAEFSRTYLTEGMSFAVKARREGNHPYTSMDVGREVGSAIFLANQDRSVKVNLSQPDVTFYIEIRGKSARVFTEYIPGPGGLPFGSQGKVVAVVATEKDALAAWFMMKRGCRTVVAGQPDGPSQLLKAWVPNLRIVEAPVEELIYKENKVLAAVFGYTLADLDKIKATKLALPAFYPLSGLTDEEINNWLLKIKNW